MRPNQQRLAIYGGAFDPVHHGHINTAKALQEQLHFDKFLFLPCKLPLLKEASKASPKQRLEMLALALKNYPQFEIDQREIERDSPSYMVETLKSLRHDYPLASLNLILGIDTYAKLPQWHQWDAILTLANLIVIDRSNFDPKKLSALTQSLLNQKQVSSTKELFSKHYGSILRINAGNYPISSTEIRKMLMEDKEIGPLLPSDVKDYILENKLYQA